MKLLKNKLAVTIIVLSVTFLGLIGYTVKRDNRSIIESGAGTALSPIQTILYKATNQVKETLDFFLNFSEVKSQNKELVKENEKLKDKLASYSDLEEENERLKQQLDFQDQKDNYDYISTNIMGISGGNITNGYIIDKGSEDGIKKGMAVKAASGLVGKVSSVGNHWAIVEGIINENIKVSVMVNETRDQTGMLSGYRDSTNNKNLVQVTDLPIDSEVKEGDTIVTSGIGMVYPKEVEIGKVISVSEDKVKVMKTAIVEPSVDFNKIEELFVIVPKNSIDVQYED